MKDIYSPEQLAALQRMKALISDIYAQLDALAALGIDVDERRAMNATRQAMCERCEQVRAEYLAGQKG